MRQNTFLSALPGMHCGPSLLAAGQWTKGKLFIANLVESPACERCGGDFEDLQHRLWDCPANRPRLDKLLATLSPEVAENTPHGLPPCLLRCGLCPQHLPISNSDVSRLQTYLDQVSIEATTATASARSKTEGSHKAGGSGVMELCYHMTF